MKNTIQNIIIGLLLFTALIGCEKEYEPVSFFASAKYTVTDSIVNLGGKVSFIDMSMGVTTRKWTFPGGDSVKVDANGKDTLTAPIIHVNFMHPGIHKIRLQDEFQVDTVKLDTTFIVNVREPVVANFTSNSEWNNDSFITEAGEEVQFTSSSTGGADNFEWVFEGGLPSAGDGEQVSTVFKLSGNYNISLIAKRENPQHSDTIVKQIKVNPAPIKLLALKEREDQTIQLLFNGLLKTFSEQETNFTVNLNGTQQLNIESVGLDEDDNTIINIKLSDQIYSNDEITISYSGQSIVTSDGDQPIEMFTAQPVEMFIKELVPDAYSLDNVDWTDVWKDHNNKNSSFERSVEQVYSGSGSLHVKAPVGGGSAYFGINGSYPELIHIDANKEYKVSFYVYISEKPSSIQFRLLRDLNNVWGSNPQILWTNFGNVELNTWTEVSFTFNAGDAGFSGEDTPVGLLFQFGLSKGYDMLMEDFSLMELDVRPE